MGHRNVRRGALASASIDDWHWATRPEAADAGPLTVGRQARVAWSRAAAPVAMLVTGSVGVAFALAVHVDAVSGPGLRAALETMMTLFAFAAAWLLRAQFTSSRRLRDLLLVGAALALGLTNLWASALPAAMDEGARSSFSSAELWGQIGGGAILAAAAFTRPDRLVIRSRRPVVIIGLLVLGALAVSGLGALLWAAQSGAGLPGHMLSRRWVPLLVFAAAGPMAYAAAAFTRRRQQEGDRTAALLALAALLLASATASDLLTRSLPAGTIGADDGLRLIAFSLILAAAVVLERRVRRRLAKSAALAERRRVARDLHDGLAQDLAFIAAHGPSIAQEMGDQHPVVVAARRALAISRNTISELADPDGATAHESLEAVAHELRDRFDVKIAVDAQPGADIASHAREHLSRIAREAIANAARHGRARNVVVSLRHAERGVALRVIDDGCGIAKVDGEFVAEGFGLTSMRERAAALGGSMSVRSAPRGGTELEVVLP